MPAGIPYFQLRKGPPYDRRPRIPSASIIPFGSLGNSGVFFEFYCTNGGSNVNAGDDENAAAYYTTTNGNWDNTNKIFTPTDGSNPAASGVRAGKMVSIYLDAATVTTLVGLVSTVENAVNGRIFVNASSVAGGGTATGATGRTLKAGGSWFGPTSTGTVTFPLNTSWNFANLVTVLGGRWIRINFKNDRTYSINSGLQPTGSNTIYQGYSITPGDGGRATFDGGGMNASVMSLQSNTVTFADLILTNATTTSGNHGFTGAVQHAWFFRCVVHDVGGNGFNFGNSAEVAIECEAYLCNKSNTAAGGGFSASSGCTAIYCVSHHNAGSNSSGFVFQSAASQYQYRGCIAAVNGAHGINLVSPGLSGFSLIENCDFYNNTLDGVINGNTTVSSQHLIRNCNFIKNGRYGFNNTTTTGRTTGFLMNCGFGDGTQANGAGRLNGTDQMFIMNNVIYAPDVTPYLDPTSGKFDIILQAAISAGAGSFTITQASYGPTIGYPDIGAAQAQGAVTFWTGSDLDLPYGYLGGRDYIFDWLFPIAETISLVGGSLPPGLSLTQVSSSEWKISGQPTTLGSYTATLRATVSSGSYGDATFNITILDDPDEGFGFAGGF